MSSGGLNFPTRLVKSHRGGVGLISPIRPHIYADPPKSIVTRKKERVTEADVLWMTRPDGNASDPTRINEGIRYFARGVNPSVEIDYSGLGQGSRTHNAKLNRPGSLYKLDSVRPPMFPVETTIPFSRPRTHQNKSVESNPGLQNGYSSTTIFDQLDNETVNSAVRSEHQAALPMTVQATSHYQIAEPFPMSAKWAINDSTYERFNFTSNPGLFGQTDPSTTDAYLCRETSPYGTIIRPKAQASTALNGSSYMPGNMNSDASGKVRDSLIVENVRPNYQLVVYDPSNHVATQVQANLREKQNIAVKAAAGIPIDLQRPDGSKIKLSTRNWTVVQTNVGVDQVILTLENPDIQLERNTPLYAAESNYTLPVSDINQRSNPNLDLPSKIAVEAYAPIDLSQIGGYGYDALHDMQDMTHLDDRPRYGSFENVGNAIPRWNSVTAPPVRTRDNSRMHAAYNQSFDRTFQ